MSRTGEILLLLAVAAGCALAARHLRSPGALTTEPPIALDDEPADPRAVPTPVAARAERTPAPPPPQAGPEAPSPAPRPKRVALTPVVAEPPTPGQRTNEELWKTGLSGSPDVGIPRRVVALEELLTRSLTTEERVRALSQLASWYRAGKIARQNEQVTVLKEVLQLAGPESEIGQRATVQMGWPLAEMGRKQEAYDTVLPLTTSPHATERYRGLAHWAALVFALELDKMPEAEEHFAALQANKEPALRGTRVLARQRMAAARRAKNR